MKSMIVMVFVIFVFLGGLLVFGCLGGRMTDQSNGTNGGNNTSIIACTEEAMLCPDGSSVGRTGPNCSFAPCPIIVGNDSDEHGCKASAGYSWCEEKQKCIRSWEESCVDLNCSCPTGYRQDGDGCTPECYYGTPPCLSPSIKCLDLNNEPEQLTEDSCVVAGGHWNECGSACRGAPEGTACTLQCVQYCECGGIAGFGCPDEYYCTDYVPENAADAMGICKPGVLK